MNCKVLGSSSSGNCYYFVANNGKSIIVDVGLPFADIKRGINYNLENVEAIFVTHQHKDHAKSIPEFLNCGIPIYSCNEVANIYCGVKVITKQGVTVGDYTVKSFALNHDVECIGYMIQHEEMGKTIVASDTCEVPFKFKDLNHIFIEANYCYDIMLDNIMNLRINNTQANRTQSSHMSIAKTMQFLDVNFSPSVRNIILIHLSSSNSNFNEFAKKIRDKYCVGTFIAYSGLEIELNKELF